MLASKILMPIGKVNKGDGKLRKQLGVHLLQPHATLHVRKPQRPRAALGLFKLHDMSLALTLGNGQ
eukprot:4435958-Amphidinium_carterae.1